MGSRKRDMRAFLVGGGSVIPTVPGQPNIGRMNVNFARESLGKENITIVSTRNIEYFMAVFFSVKRFRCCLICVFYKTKIVAEAAPKLIDLAPSPVRTFTFSGMHDFAATAPCALLSRP